MVDARTYIFSAAAPFFIFLNPAYADETHKHDQEHDQEHHAHEAHVHGAWELFAALDDKQLSVTVKGPIVDLLGFERPPADETERSAVETLKGRLGESETLFSLSDRASCVLSEPIQTVLPAGFADKIDQDDPGAHKHDDQPHDHHGDEHDDEDHHSDEHDGEDHHDNHDIHASDLEINYVFDCASPSKLSEISATVFDSFAAIESIDAVFLGDAKQTARRLERHSRTLKID